MSNKVKAVTVKDKAQYKTDLTTLTTTSSKIRALHSEGLSRGQISAILEIRYQHVRNVLITPIKKQA